MQVTRTQAIETFLQAKAHRDLAALYNQGMECQVNVAQDGGERIESEYKGKMWRGWTDGIQTWKPIRIPHNADGEPKFEDRWMTFDLGQHAEGIGMTGWDFKNRLSRWVAYDFDAITGHKDKHKKKLTDVQLEEIRKIVSDIEWVTLRKSTGGKGLHLYVFLDAIPTSNHTEHAALARAILGKMSAITKMDLNTQVDVCGQNMWVWHRKITPENGGLELLKRGTTLKEVPPHWRDHVKVISGSRKKTLPKFVSSQEPTVQSKFDDLSSQITQIPLDDIHKKLILYLEEKGSGSYWDADHHMLVTHTYWLKKAHEELGLRGKFETESAGTEAPSDINVFAFPMRRGGWAVRRYSLGVGEHVSWEQDGKGWTRCYYNTEPTLPSAARMFDGIEDQGGWFNFNEAQAALDCLHLLGASTGNPSNALLDKKTKIKQNKDGRIIVEVEGDERGILSKEEAMKGWLFKKGKWSRIFNITSNSQTEVESAVYDDQVRHLVTNNGEDAGWCLRGEVGNWQNEPLTHVQSALFTLGLKPNEIKSVVGSSVLKAWKLVNMPFQPEYPGDRVWNRHAAQLRFTPSQGETFTYPHWSKILDHIGSGLNVALQTNPWAKSNGVFTGADYLKLWIASMFRFPLEPLPYLFLYGPQNSGKSILHESLSLLFTHGYARAESALTNQNKFNAELLNAVLCVVEEINLQRDKNAASRIKDYVTARDLLIHAKGQTPYQIANSTHWIQAANEATACPVLPGDTRITSIYVEPFADITQMIPKKIMMEKLEQEAADFLGEILSLDIPPSNDRLNVPVIRTAEKISLEHYNRSPIEVFLADKMYEVSGECVEYSHMYEQFIQSLDATEAQSWTKRSFGKELPPQFPKGRNRKDGHYIVGNLTFNKPEPDAPRKPRLVATAPDANDNVFLESENGNDAKRDT